MSGAPAGPLGSPEGGERGGGGGVQVQVPGGEQDQAGGVQDLGL